MRIQFLFSLCTIVGFDPQFVLLIAPVIYLVVGFIFTAIGALLYNLVASVIGGIEFTTKEVD